GDVASCELWCDLYNRAMSWHRFSRIVLAIAFASATTFTARGESFLHLLSEPGDPDAEGQQWRDVRGSRVAFAVEANAAGGVDFKIFFNCAGKCPSPGSSDGASELLPDGAIRFAPAAGQLLGVGAYESVQRYMDIGGSSPGLLYYRMDYGRCPVV